MNRCLSNEKNTFADNSRDEPTIFFMEKQLFSLKLLSGDFYGQSFIKTVRGPFVLKLQQYTFTVKHLKGSENISDILSRTPVDCADNATCDLIEHDVNSIVHSNLPISLTLDELQKECEAE